MAVIKQANGKFKKISPKDANKLWLVLRGEAEGDSATQDLAMQTEKLYLNWRNPDTPDSYIEAHKDIIFPMVVGQWIVQGRRTTEGHTVVDEPITLVGPEPSDVTNIRFSKKWGLIEDGMPTILARRYSN